MEHDENHTNNNPRPTPQFIRALATKPIAWILDKRHLPVLTYRTSYTRALTRCFEFIEFLMDIERIKLDDLGPQHPMHGGDRGWGTSDEDPLRDLWTLKYAAEDALLQRPTTPARLAMAAAMGRFPSTGPTPEAGPASPVTRHFIRDLHDTNTAASASASDNTPENSTVRRSQTSVPAGRQEAREENYTRKTEQQRQMRIARGKMTSRKDGWIKDPNKLNPLMGTEHEFVALMTCDTELRRMVATQEYAGHELRFLKSKLKTVKDLLDASYYYALRFARDEDLATVQAAMIARGQPRVPDILQQLSKWVSNDASALYICTELLEKAQQEVEARSWGPPPQQGLAGRRRIDRRLGRWREATEQQSIAVNLPGYTDMPRLDFGCRAPQPGKPAAKAKADAAAKAKAKTRQRTTATAKAEAAAKAKADAEAKAEAAAAVAEAAVCVETNAKDGGTTTSNRQPHYPATTETVAKRTRRTRARATEAPTRFLSMLRQRMDGTSNRHTTGNCVVAMHSLVIRHHPADAHNDGGLKRLEVLRSMRHDTKRAKLLIYLLKQSKTFQEAKTDLEAAQAIRQVLNELDRPAEVSAAGTGSGGETPTDGASATQVEWDDSDDYDEVETTHGVAEAAQVSETDRARAQAILNEQNARETYRAYVAAMPRATAPQPPPLGVVQPPEVIAPTTHQIPNVAPATMSPIRRWVMGLRDLLAPRPTGPVVTVVSPNSPTPYRGLIGRVVNGSDTGTRLSDRDGSPGAVGVPEPSAPPMSPPQAELTLNLGGETVRDGLPDGAWQVTSDVLPDAITTLSPHYGEVLPECDLLAQAVTPVYVHGVVPTRPETGNTNRNEKGSSGPVI